MMLACEKNESGTEDPSLSSTKGGPIESLGAPAKPAPTMTMSIDPAPALVGEDIAITVGVEYEGNPVNCGTLRLQKATDGNGNPVPTTYSAITWVEEVSFDAPGGVYVMVGGYGSPGLYGWRLFYQSTGPGCSYENLTGDNQALKMDVQVVEGNCAEPLTITPYLVKVSSEDGIVFTFETKWVVKACEEFTNLKTQGGLVAKAKVISTSPAASNIKVTKQNTIINWIEPAVHPGDEFEYIAVYELTLKNVCTEYPITGDWSAKAWWEVTKTVDDFDAEGNPIGSHEVTVNEEYVAGYYNRIYFTTPCE